MRAGNGMKEKIALACDHKGYPLKDSILHFLESQKYEVVDCGTHSEESTDYPDYVLKAAENVAQGVCAKAVGVCYTGIGSAIAANKVRGVRAALVHSVKEAELSRSHNDSNMLILGAGFLEISLLIPILQTWLSTPFDGGRHEKRVNKIKDYEQRHTR